MSKSEGHYLGLFLGGYRGSGGSGEVLGVRLLIESIMNSV